MAKSFSPVVSPAIVLGALATFKATDAKLTKVMAAISGDRSKAVNQVLDAMWVACDQPKEIFMKGNAATNAARAQVKNMFDAIVEAGHLESNTAKSYQTCFWIAFKEGVAWSPDLANKKSAAKSDSGTDSADSAIPKAGAATQTNRAELDKTISKALAQARAIGLTDFAAEMLDLCLDRLDNFKETVLAK
jgi:hypothetical protein